MKSRTWQIRLATVAMIAAGDYNSGPLSTVKGAYNLLTSPSKGKLRDAANAGLTCCREFLNQFVALSRVIDERAGHQRTGT